MNENINILIVEDDNGINTLLARLMEKKGYGVVQAYSGTEAMLHIEAKDFQLVILDLMLPGITGEELIKNIRKTKQMPVIVISAKIDKKDKIELLNLGADDYITKPFDIEEVCARVYSNLRRYMKFSNNNVSVNENLTYKDIVLNKETKEVCVNGKNITFTAREFEILELLLTHPKKVFSKANLFESVWGEEYLGDDNTVNVHMSNLRSKLQKANPKEEYIETIWGMGYKII
ncbi:XRE family transcriptional regulator [Clostridium carboxidivorans P7]|uniref:Stage 0 sporulation protein A homolog n=1 Tax=Clostridium carboxidivorans P7 TaxID=536227 RepID=C6PN05_9CLOT|nr:response regulator transcription factor [Clostridium carboxidivorans]AKN30888.1 XRE family transcriptional regulator [Clostridium carboxidivorans P7]EET89338.1 two component transcriptional regulator, winged helix family [Clostridium carboxidivorans P7]EFG88864.1 putative regulatory protein VanR [Clostridium carboxidivorans P7]